MYVYCYYRVISKAPKKLSNCLKRAETSVDLIVFDCVLFEVRAYKHKCCYCFFPSLNMNQVYQKTILYWSIIKYSKKYSVNATAQIEQVQDKKNSNGTAEKYY